MLDLSFEAQAILYGLSPGDTEESAITALGAAPEGNKHFYGNEEIGHVIKSMGQELTPRWAEWDAAQKVRRSKKEKKDWWENMRGSKRGEREEILEKKPAWKAFMARADE